MGWIGDNDSGNYEWSRGGERCLPRGDLGVYENANLSKRFQLEERKDEAALGQGGLRFNESFKQFEGSMA